MFQRLCILSIVLYSAAAGAQTAKTVRPEGISWVAEMSPQVSRVTSGLAGTWKTSETFSPNPYLKQGAVGTGVFTVQTGPGGNSVVIAYNSRSNAGPYKSNRTIYWDAKHSVYRAFYCDSLQPGGCGDAGAGSWDGADLVFNSTTEGPNGTFHTVERFSDITSKGFTFSNDVILEGKPMRTLTIQAKKAGTA
jgi:hypothetical protein